LNRFSAIPFGGGKLSNKQQPILLECETLPERSDDSIHEIDHNIRDRRGILLVEWTVNPEKLV